jgi:predicted small secreted protein
MKSKIIHNILVILIILLSAISYSGCKKQAKCGCGKDILFSIDTTQAFLYSAIKYESDGAIGYFQIYNGIYYDTYYFCNPSEWYAAYDSLVGIDQVKLGGDVYWDCSYINSQSNSSYYSYYKIYQVQINLLKPYLYGKK